MNPIFDRKSFVADPEAHKMSDGIQDGLVLKRYILMRTEP